MLYFYIPYPPEHQWILVKDMCMYFIIVLHSLCKDNKKYQTMLLMIYIRQQISLKHFDGLLYILSSLVSRLSIFMRHFQHTFILLMRFLLRVIINKPVHREPHGFIMLSLYHLIILYRLLNNKFQLLFFLTSQSSL